MDATSRDLVQRDTPTGRHGGVLRSLGQWLLPPVCPLCYRSANAAAEAHGETGSDEIWCGPCATELDTCRIDPDRVCRRCSLPTAGAIRTDRRDGPAALAFGPEDLPISVLETDGLQPVCDHCEKSPDHPAIDHMRCVFAYHGLVSRGVVASKYSSRIGLIHAFAREVATQLRSLATDRAAIVTHVPSHLTRRFSRGGCSVETLARTVAAGLGRPHRGLVRVRRRIEKQAWLDDDQRRQNVAGAFAVRDRERKRLAGSHVILIDDVVTTGSTTGEIATILKTAGVARVTVASIARTIRR